MAALCFFSSSWIASAVIAPGRAAPALKLDDSAGVERDLFAKGEVTMIVFSKPIDRDTTHALTALDGFLAKNDNLGAVQRCVVISRIETGDAASGVKTLARAKWKLRIDAEDRAYRAYGIIATPSVVIVGKDGAVAAVHPGYDPGLVQHVMQALAQALGVKLPATASSPIPRLDPNIVMGRRLAGRKLWDRALPYYERARLAGKLSEGGLLELAEVYIEVDRGNDAVGVLESINKHSALWSAARDLIEKARRGSPTGRSRPEAAPRDKD